MFRLRQNYLGHFLQKIDDFKSLMKFFESSLNEVKNYYDKTCNHNSDSDYQTLLILNNLYDKAKYYYMYLTILYD